MLWRNDDQDIVFEKRRIPDLAVSNWVANESQVELAFEKRFERIVGGFKDQLHLHAGKFLLKESQARREPVVGGVALRGEPDQSLGGAAVFVDVGFRAIEFFKHGASGLHVAITR